MASQKASKDSKSGHDNEAFKQDASSSAGQLPGSTQVPSHVGNIQEQPEHRTLGKQTSQAGVDDDDEDKVDLSCGIWKLRTNIFGAKFSNLYVFSVCMGVSAFFTMMVSSILNIQLTSIQRQFKIDNSRAGLFDTASRIGSLTTILFAGHFAKKVNIPLVIGFAGLIQGAVLMIPAFLQFADPYTLQVITDNTNTNNTTDPDYGENGNYLCRTSDYFLHGNHTQKNTTDEDANQLAFVIMLVVQAAKGVTDAFHSGFLPALYVDDNMVDKTKMGIFFGINSIISELANPIGKQINGILSKVPVDLIDTKMDVKDTRFVAAWWMAFLIFGAGTLVFSIPVMLFPRKLVSKRQQEEALKKAMVTFTTGENNSPQDGSNQDQDPGNQTETVKGINSSRPPSHYRKRSLAARISTHSLGVDGLGPFPLRRSSMLPPVDGPSERRISIDGTMVFEQPIKPKEAADKAEEIQGSASLKDLLRDFPKAFVRVFSRPVFIFIIVDIIIGSITWAGTAMFRSVYINNEYNVPIAEVALMQGMTQAGGQILGTLISGWLANRVNTKLGYNNIIIVTHLLSMCITPLYIIFGCPNKPIYGHEGSFGIPVNMTDICQCQGTSNLLSCGEDGNNYLSPCYAGCQAVDVEVFTQCSGLTEYNNITLTSGLCDSDCYENFVLYVVLHAVQATLYSMSSIPMRLLILRMVDPRDRGFATSVFGFCSILMAIPAPNLFGKVIDATCLVWNGRTCSLYDRDKIRYFLSGLDVGVSIIMMLIMLTIYYFFRREEILMKKKIEEEGADKIQNEIKI